MLPSLSSEIERALRRLWRKFIMGAHNWCLHGPFFLSWGPKLLPHINTTARHTASDASRRISFTHFCACAFRMKLKCAHVFAHFVDIGLRIVPLGICSFWITHRAENAINGTITQLLGFQWRGRFSGTQTESNVFYPTQFFYFVLGDLNANLRAWFAFYSPLKCHLISKLLSGYK